MSSWVVYAGIVTRGSAKAAEHAGYAVEKIIYNKDYNHRSHDGDIALMKLRTPLNFSGESGEAPDDTRDMRHVLLSVYGNASYRRQVCGLYSPLFP